VYRADRQNKYKNAVDLVGVQGVRWDMSGTEHANEYTFFYGKWNENHELGSVFFLYVGESFQQLSVLSVEVEVGRIPPL
jgi:hypothetical protein